MANDIFGASDDLTIYNKLLEEIEHSGVDNQRLWQLWHGDSHVIADRVDGRRIPKLDFQTFLNALARLNGSKAGDEDGTQIRMIEEII